MLWAALFIAVLFLGGAQLVLISVLGEYVERIYGEVKRRPLYLREGAAGLPSPAAQSAAPQSCSCPPSGISPGTPSGLFTSACRAVSSPDGAGRTLFPGRAPISPRRWASCAPRPGRPPSSTCRPSSGFARAGLSWFWPRCSCPAPPRNRRRAGSVLVTVCGRQPTCTVENDAATGGNNNGPRGAVAR